MSTDQRDTTRTRFIYKLHTALKIHETEMKKKKTQITYICTCKWKIWPTNLSVPDRSRNPVVCLNKTLSNYSNTNLHIIQWQATHPRLPSSALLPFHVLSLSPWRPHARERSCTSALRRVYSPSDASRRNTYMPSIWAPRPEMSVSPYNIATS